MEKKTACVMCGSESLRLDQSEKTVEIGDVAAKVPFRMHWCESCGGEMALSEDLRFNARVMRQARKKHHGLLTGEEVRKIRKQLGLSQDQAAKLFGGGPVAFSKYENDEITQSEAMDRLIWLVGTVPGLAHLLGRRLKIELTFDAKTTLETTAAEFKDQYIAQARVITEVASNYLSGFGAFSTASNEEIYERSNKARAVERVTA